MARFGAVAYVLIVVLVLPLRSLARRRRNAVAPSVISRSIEATVLLVGLVSLLWAQGYSAAEFGLDVSFGRHAFAALCSATLFVAADYLFVSWHLARGGETLQLVQSLEASFAAPDRNRSGGLVVYFALGAAWEEVCFRAVPVALAGPSTDHRVGMLVAANVAFALQHLRSGATGVLYSFGFGAAYGVTYIVSGSLPAVILAHACGNIAAMLFTAKRLRGAQAARTALF